MVMVPIISFTAFIVILAALNWQWVVIGAPVNFAHSVLGIIVISLSIIQVTI